MVPLYAGSVHYWRLEPSDWRPALDRPRSSGSASSTPTCRGACTRSRPGEADFGENDPRRDVVAFLRLAHELGLYAIVRPGPHINAELTYFGIPERIVWDPECQARSPQTTR